MELIERVEVKSRSYYYKVKDLYTKE